MGPPTIPARRTVGSPTCFSLLSPLRRLLVKELVRYLLENLYLDFQGEISLDTVRQFLRGDDSREAKALLQKLIEDKGVDDLLITLADVLKEHIRTGVNEQVMREQLSMYSES
jgi:hypothetical protein